MTAELSLDAIHIEERHRRDLGDISTLAESIDTLGLIHPVVITPDYRLVAGERRLAAARELGWDVIPVTVIHSLGDYASILEAERDENTCRKDFTPTEAAAIRATIAQELAPLAEERKAQAPGKPRGTKVSGGNLPQEKTRETAAKGTGYSGRTLDKVDKTREIAEDTSQPGSVRETARQALDEMDQTGNVDAPYKQATEAKTVHEALGEFPELSFYADQGRNADVLRLAAALRGYVEPERSVRLDALRRTIAAEQIAQREPSDTDDGPDYLALAHRIFLAANTAAQAIEKFGARDTVANAVSRADHLMIANWKEQFVSLSSMCSDLADVCSPKLEVIK